MSHRINLTESYILHTRAFRDTSLLLNVFSLKHGHLMLLARGVRKQKSPLRALLLPFTPLLISWAGKADLPTLSKAETGGKPTYLSGKALLNGLYLNELLVRLLERQNAYPNLYLAYQKTLEALHDNQNQPLALRLFEKKLLAELGYGLQLQRQANGVAISPDEKYYFTFGIGFEKAKPPYLPQKAFFTGKSLLALHNEQFADAKELDEAEQLLKSALQAILGNRSLKSRELF